MQPQGVHVQNTADQQGCLCSVRMIIHIKWLSLYQIFCDAQVSDRAKITIELRVKIQQNGDNTRRSLSLEGQSKAVHLEQS